MKLGFLSLKFVNISGKQNKQITSYFECLDQMITIEIFLTFMFYFYLFLLIYQQSINILFSFFIRENMNFAEFDIFGFQNE